MCELTRESEEIQMLLEVAKSVTDEFAHVIEKGEKLSPAKKGEISGRITENVIRSHLIEKGFNIPSHRVYIDMHA